MTVCKYFLQGNCRFGDNCKFEHPRNPPRYQSANRFAPLQSPGERGGRPRQAHSGHGGREGLPYCLDYDTLERDLREELPQWIFSAFGPGRDAPRQLFGGYPLEQSFEEMRVMYYLGQASANVQPAIEAERDLTIRAHQQIRSALNDVKGAIKYVIEGENEPQNRWWVCDTYRGTGPPVKQQNNQQASSGQPSTFGSNPQRPGFGTPSLPQQPNQGPFPAQSGAFGQPSKLGASSAFGQPSALGTGSFGKPSALGQPSAFGQPSAPVNQSPFSTLGAGTSQGSNVTQTSAIGNAGFGAEPAFGPPRSLTASGPFASNLSSTIQAGGSGGFGPFASPDSRPGPSITSSSAFPLPNKPPSANPFTTSTQRPINGAFGASSGLISPIGLTRTQPTEPLPTHSSSLFTPSANGTQNGPSRDLGLSAGGTFTPPLETYITRDPTNRLRTFKNRPVTYISGVPYCTSARDGALERIWFPEGPPPHNLDTEDAEDKYDERTQNAYKVLAETGVFAGGIMPEVPPKWSWVRWDI